jgi:hypothetical protein
MCVVASSVQPHQQDHRPLATPSLVPLLKCLLGLAGKFSVAAADWAVQKLIKKITKNNIVKNVILLNIKILCLCCRFDRTISVDTPDIKGREQIFRVHLGKLKLEKIIEHYSGACWLEQCLL